MFDLNFSIYNIIHILLVFVELLLMLVLLTKGRHLMSNKLMALFLFTQIIFSLNELYVRNVNFNYKDYPFLAYIALPFYTLWAVFMYLYIKSQSTTNFSFKKKHFIHFIPFVLLTLYFLFTYHIYTTETKTALLHSKEVLDSKSTWFFMVFLIIQILIYNVMSVFSLEKYARKQVLKQTQIVSRIQWNRFIIYGYFVACINDDVMTLIFVYSEQRNIPIFLYASSFLFLVYFSIVLGKALLSSHFGDSIRLSKQKEISQDEFTELNLILTYHMKTQKTFLKPGLTLSELATTLDVNERLLSRFINLYYQKTFQDFINLHRIEEAKKILTESIHTEKTILEIVYESGFNSKSAFNYAFKKHTQTTPTQYKKSLQM